MEVFEELASKDVANTSNDTDNDRFPRFISIHTSSVSDHTTEEGVNESGGIISELSLELGRSVGNIRLEEHGKGASTETTHEGVGGGFFSGEPSRMVAHDDAGTSIEENELEPEDEATENNEAEVGDTEFFIFIFEDLSSEVGKIFSGGNVSRKISLVSFRSSFSQVFRVLEDFLEIAIFVISRANNQQTSKTSESTSTMDHTRASEIVIVEVFVQPTTTPSPGDNDGIDESVHKEGVDSGSFQGSTFRDGSTSDGRNDASNTDLEDPMTILSGQFRFSIGSIFPIITSKEGFTTNETSFGTTKGNSVTTKPPSKRDNTSIDRKFMPNDMRILFADTTSFKKGETNLHGEDDTTADDDPGLVQTFGKF